MSETLDPERLAGDLEAVRTRIAAIVAAVSDADIRERLARLREHVAGAADTLRPPTRTNLARVAQRVRYATKQLDLLTGWPKPKPRTASKRERET